MSRIPNRSGGPDTDEAESKTEQWLIAAVAIVLAGLFIWFIAKIFYVNQLVEMSGEWYDQRAVFYRVSAIIVFTLFIPFTAVSYFYSRRRERERELREDFNMLKLNYPYYVEVYSKDNRPIHFFLAAGFASIVTVLGLIAVLLGDELGLDVGPNLLLGGAFVESHDKRPELEAAGRGPIAIIVPPPTIKPAGSRPVVSGPAGTEAGEQSETPPRGASLEGESAAGQSATQNDDPDRGDDADAQQAPRPSQAEAQQPEAPDEEQTSVQRNSLMFFGIAFLGAYLWGLQQIIIRYFRNDLVPGVYYNLGVRMIFAAIIALLIYQMIHAFGLDPAGGRAGFGTGILPAMAFLIGIFPQRALRYMTERVDLFSSATQSGVRTIPLETIQGITVDDKLRLVEVGIDTVSDLANADVIRLLFSTPYTTNQLIDWQLQAKLCVLVGEDIRELQAHAVRTARDLKYFTEEGGRSLEVLAEETKITKNTILAAHRSISEDGGVTMLIKLYDRVNSVDNLRKSTTEPTDEMPEGHPDSQQAGVPMGAAASGEQEAGERGDGQGDADSGASRAATTGDVKPAKAARAQRPEDRAAEQVVAAKKKAARPDPVGESAEGAVPAGAVAEADSADKKNGGATSPKR